jgi:hypothetical protein
VTAEMSSTTQHEIKPAATVLADDVICQSFIQSSSTLAYACLLIRQKKFDLATHVLHSLEAKQASRFKDMVFYLQVQIGIETGEFGVVKKRLLPRVIQHPNDLVALSLLEANIHLEWVAWLEHQATGIGPVSVKTAEVAQVQSTRPSSPVAQPLEMVRSHETLSNHLAPEKLPKVEPVLNSEGAENDFGIYQALAIDENTHAMALGNVEKGRIKSSCRNGKMEALIAVLPQILPGNIASACHALEGGEIHKICFSFQNLTVTSFHMGGEFLELVTGNINQSLLTMVRAENIFQKQSASAQGRARLGAQPFEILPHD